MNSEQYFLKNIYAIYTVDFNINIGEAVLLEDYWSAVAVMEKINNNPLKMQIQYIFLSVHARARAYM